MAAVSVQSIVGLVGCEVLNPVREFHPSAYNSDRGAAAVRDFDRHYAMGELARLATGKEILQRPQ
jgi:hypothetical protein